MSVTETGTETGESAAGCGMMTADGNERGPVHQDETETETETEIVERGVAQDTDAILPDHVPEEMIEKTGGIEVGPEDVSVPPYANAGSVPGTGEVSAI